ncbi:unnamed protein product [marine sediment metagenome]|uniref:Uncharacterized protein n=1 Tax=marine sediment metagenome TaxID=412755 RepID=X0V8T0_9ZZZZ
MKIFFKIIMYSAVPLVALSWVPVALGYPVYIPGLILGNILILIGATLAFIGYIKMKKAGEKEKE